jgi:cellulose synthase/poly-beta-1,6-N-acetylglucosamine synthase-like glycosyltransferase
MDGTNNSLTLSAAASRARIGSHTDTDIDLTPGLTVIVPAFNEERSIAETIRSLQTQTRRPDRIIVVDDGSSDGTAEVAESMGVTVLRPPANTGSKAGAQTFALPEVRTELAMAVDADTTLADDAIETLLGCFDDADVAAASGAVVPRRVRSVWERGRYVEYLFAFAFFKRIQDHYGKPMISSGCFSAYRTRRLREVGGWSTRTLAEDMDLTWTLYGRGCKVRFVPEAVCYPIEPHNLDLLRKQLRRWSHGFVQNVLLHRRGLLRLGYLRSMIALAFWDAVVASVAFLVVIPALAMLVSPLFLLGYVMDAPVVLLPVLVDARRRGELRKALASFPSYFVLRALNGVMMLAALVRECVLRRPLLQYEKGH